MRHTYRHLPGAIPALLFLLCSFFTASAQTHTPRYISMTAKTKAFYEYLPEGYSTSGSQTYPLILFISGIGEFGDGTSAQLPWILKFGLPQRIQSGVFPKSFLVNGQTHRFIVISPQFVKFPRPTAADIEEVLGYILANYRVDKSRIYLTGLSYGGGLTWGYPGENTIFSNRLAAIVPVAGAGDPIYKRARNIAAGNVAVWALHNESDPSAPSATTKQYISWINEPPAPNPPARATYFTTATHDAWSKAYDPLFKENNMNIYEWMLLNKRSGASAGSNSPVCPGTTLQLEASEVAGATYSWTGPNGFASSGRTPSISGVTAAAAGNYSVRILAAGVDVTLSVPVAVSDAAKVFYKDNDGDGFGNNALQVNACTPPAGYVAEGYDCNDSDPSIRPGVKEICDGVDNDCNGLIDDGLSPQVRYYRDADGDGVGSAVNINACAKPAGYVTTTGDCNDANAAVYPGAPELCDGLDNDCDKIIDDGLSPQVYFYKDADGDGVGGTTRILACAVPPGYSAKTGDCNELNNKIYPGAPELCDGLDNDCDRLIDEGLSPQTYFYKDGDGDGYGGTTRISACARPVGYVTVTGDCNDAAKTVYPGAPELCDGLDNDCDKVVDDGLSPLNTYYQDYDKDGYGSTTVKVLGCAAPAGYIAVGGDCNDKNAAIKPGAAELCNGLDDDCDGVVDDGLSPLNTYYQDYDKDGYGSKTVMVTACAPPAGYISTGGDCDDRNAAIKPGAVEICNKKDDDCNGLIDDGLPTQTYYKDFDKDGVGSITSKVVACSQPIGYVLTTGDCNDANAAIYPGAPELCDGLDNDCDKIIDDGLSPQTTFYQDYDKDGWGSNTAKIVACAAPPGYIAKTGDCNDRNVNVNPGKAEVSGNGIDDDCDGQTDEAAAPALRTEVTEAGALSLQAQPNPAAGAFQLRISSGNTEPVTVRILDAAGKVLEVRRGVPANGTLPVGEAYRPGVYYAEVVQKGVRVMIKLVKSSD